MYCSKCGSALPDANRFCNSCGAPVKAPPPAPGATPAALRPSPAWQAAPASLAAQPQPALAVAVPQPAAGGPMPPDMHWALVWILASVTLGIVGLVWTFKEVGFVKKIDPSSKARTLLLLALLGVALQFVLMAAGIALAMTRGPEIMALIGPVMMLVNLACAVAWILAVFGMRSSLLRYYNTVEPIGLRLSGVMTFFFNLLYFQYHFSRIAEWKRTGQLR